MAKLELKIDDGAQVPIVEVKKDGVETPVPFKQRSPSAWHIVGNGKGIIATSDRGDRFEGSVKVFNRAMNVEYGP